MKNKALFLDRDGIINIEKGYVHKIEDFEFTDGIFQLCRDFQENGYIIIIITNQAGIARGYYDEGAFEKLTVWMLKQFADEGVKIAEVKHCPHHPEFTGVCKCRKPEPGMIDEAVSQHNIDVSNSVLIGDKVSDIEAGERAGVGLCILVKNIQLLRYINVNKRKS